jgi:hypothetical protein
MLELLLWFLCASVRLHLMVLFGCVMNTALHLLTLMLLASSLKDLFLLEHQQQAVHMAQVHHCALCTNIDNLTQRCSPKCMLSEESTEALKV